jgi:hypothetical protein
MLRQGPISHFVHGVIEYLAGVLLIAAPFIFDFKSGAATALAVVAGVVVLAVAASTEGQTGMIAVIPVSVHVLLDFVLAVVLVAAPFLFSFSDESAPTAFFVIIGVAHLLITIATRFKARQV